jgi:hypothetical protein
VPKELLSSVDVSGIGTSTQAAWTAAGAHVASTTAKTERIVRLLDNPG